MNRKQLNPLVLGAFVMLLVGLPSPTHAGRFQRRLNNQQARINNGTADGSLSEVESARLQARYDQIQAALIGARSQGPLSPRKKNNIRHRLNGLGSSIYFRRHNSSGQDE